MFMPTYATMAVSKEQLLEAIEHLTLNITKCEQNSVKSIITMSCKLQMYNVDKLEQDHRITRLQEKKASELQLKDDNKLHLNHDDKLHLNVDNMLHLNVHGKLHLSDDDKLCLSVDNNLHLSITTSYT